MIVILEGGVNFLLELSRSGSDDKRFLTDGAAIVLFHHRRVEFLQRRIERGLETLVLGYFLRRHFFLDTSNPAPCRASVGKVEWTAIS